MSPEEPEVSLRQFLQSVKAGEKSEAIRERTERIIHEGKLRDVLTGLLAEGFRVEESLVSVGPRPTDAGSDHPDFIVRKEDVVLHLYLAFGQRARRLRRDFIRRVSDVLNSNVTVKAVVFVWPEDGYPSTVMDAFLLRKYLDVNTEVVDVTSTGAAPINEAIVAFYNEQFIAWNIPEGLEVGAARTRGVVLEDMIRQLITSRIQEETYRRYEVSEKVEARNTLVTEPVDTFVAFFIGVLGRGELTQENIDSLEQLIKERAERS